MIFNKKISLLMLNVVCALTVPATAYAQEQSDNTIVIIERFELGHYNPVLGHGRSGESHFYQGLYRIEPGVFDRQPQLIPTLASGPAIASDKK